MKASFVIVNYNRKNELAITLAKTEELISKNRSEYEIVLIDNASTDGSAAMVKENFPDVVLIENPVNTGAPAWNLGFAKAKGNYFIIIDDDSHIEAGLEEGIAHMEKNKDIGVLALNVVSGPYTSEMWEWKDGQEIVGFIGCGAILRRETYEKIGGYADWMFLYVNEWEYGLRCINAGYSVRYFANSKVIHRASPVNRSNKRLYVFVQKHEMGIIYKHFSYKRGMYLRRATINNFKGELRKLGFKQMWWMLIGMKEFFKMKGKLAYTPVSKEAQMFYAERFHNTKSPAFSFISNGFNRIFKK
jgi:GT2 family glycosyltransferase